MLSTSSVKPRDSPQRVPGDWDSVLENIVPCFPELFPGRCHNQDTGLGKPHVLPKNTLVVAPGEEKLFCFAQDYLQAPISRFSSDLLLLFPPKRQNNGTILLPREVQGSHPAPRSLQEEPHLPRSVASVAYVDQRQRSWPHLDSPLPLKGSEVNVTCIRVSLPQKPPLLVRSRTSFTTWEGSREGGCLSNVTQLIHQPRAAALKTPSRAWPGVSRRSGQAPWPCF